MEVRAQQGGLPVVVALLRSNSAAVRPSGYLHVGVSANGCMQHASDLEATVHIRLCGPLGLPWQMNSWLRAWSANIRALSSRLCRHTTGLGGAHNAPGAFRSQIVDGRDLIADVPFSVLEGHSD